MLPVIAIVPPDDGGAALGEAVGRLSDYDWVVVTSANGVRALLGALGDLRALAGVRIAAIGPATADALRAYGLRADLVPKAFTSTAILAAMTEQGIAGQRLLLLRADIAPSDLVDGLRQAGAQRLRDGHAQARALGELGAALLAGQVAL